MNKESSFRTEDRLIINDILSRYCHAIDRLQLDELEAVFYSDAEIHNGLEFLTKAEFVDKVTLRHASVAITFHMLGNVLIEFLDQDTAFVESYCLALEHHNNSEQGAVDRTVRVRYGDLFKRRNTQWKIFQRRVVVDHEQAIPTELNASAQFFGTSTAGVRNADDPLIIMRDRCKGQLS